METINIIPIDFLEGSLEDNKVVIKNAVRDANIFRGENYSGILMIDSLEASSSGKENISTEDLERIKEFGYSLTIINRGFTNGNVVDDKLRITDDLYGVVFDIKNTFYATKGHGQHIEYDGKIIASYFDEYKTLILHFGIELCKSLMDKHTILEHTIKQIKMSSGITIKKDSINKEDIKGFASEINVLNKDELERAQNTLGQLERENVSLRQSIKTNFDRCIKTRKEIEHLKDTEEQEKRLIIELENIINIPDIEQISTHSKNIKVKTKLLYGHTQQGNVFKLAPYTIDINFKSGDVIFSCNDEYKRQSYWSESDIHPHIARNGQPCWGSVGSTIAQLISEFELMALVTMLLNYLKNINTDDVAGQKCINWDEVDPDTKEIILYAEDREKDLNGNPIRGAICEICENDINEDESYYCSNCDQYVCEECAIYLSDISDYGCTECSDIVRCDSCEDYITQDNAIWCDECDAHVCERCVTTKEIGDNIYKFCEYDCSDSYIDREAYYCEECDSYYYNGSELYCENSEEIVCENCAIGIAISGEYHYFKNEDEADKYLEEHTVYDQLSDAYIYIDDAGRCYECEGYFHIDDNMIQAEDGKIRCIACDQELIRERGIQREEV